MYTPSAQGRITLNQHFVVISRRSYHLRALTSRPALAEQARKSKSEQGLRQDDEYSTTQHSSSSFLVQFGMMERVETDTVMMSRSCQATWSMPYAPKRER
jgi:hypothetical protein